MVRTAIIQRGLRLAAVFLCATAGVGMACNPAIKSTQSAPLTAAQLAELWVDPGTGRDLFYGVGGPKLAPDPSAKYTVIEIKRGGYSRGYTVIGPGDREWSAKFPPEAGTELVASRIHWGIGCRPAPHLSAQRVDGREGHLTESATAGSFPREEPKSEWARCPRPVVFLSEPVRRHARTERVAALQAMLGNSDLKDVNNVLYTLKAPREGTARWYVTRDLGHTFGRTGVIDAPRGDIDVFEKTPVHPRSGKR